ncbi:hypothetical protein DSC45_31630 [Streptomyces sp. YIM 130001]|uniref:hypothetical protein n=1 Tax=Streptomyces sp. YIM 130001 TaxID=2259644 RepID=UPI000E652B07|nr:hypothetical protein [Streptomyces sp. YIM 130001]RII09240.1 hypothetical protein DSC45_31630 [Streptomyces sp. YIM 130001]
MSTAAAQSPIYDTLVEEHGDVLATARQAAEEIQQQADDVLHFGRPVTAAPAAPAQDHAS